MTIADPWIPILNQLKLSRAERAAVERYQNAPQGRTFLPIADILLSHHLVDECIELLIQGVTRHPRFTVARVILARELFNKGLMAEAWRTLEASPDPLDENVLAQKIRFKLALVLAEERLAKRIYNHLLLHRMFDAETKRLGEMLEVREFSEVRQRFLDELEEKGIIPLDVEVVADPAMEAAASLAPPVRAEEPEVFPYEDEGQKKITGFHVVPLNEIFALAMAGHDDGGNIGGSIELDSTTLAEIYESQGHYHKALNIYRRLLKLSPNNDFIKCKIAEVSRLRREQKQDDLTIDPGVVEQMESVEICNQQIRFLNNLLHKLD